MVQVVPSGEVWIWNAVAYAASHCSTTWVTDAVAPRSTCSHCGSLNALDQRVPVLPSTAFDAGNDAFSTDDAVAGLPCDSNVDAAVPGLAEPTVSVNGSQRRRYRDDEDPPASERPERDSARSNPWLPLPLRSPTAELAALDLHFKS